MNINVRTCLTIKFILSIILFFPVSSFAHLLSITATVPFPSTVFALSTTNAIFTVTNITSQTTLTVIDRSHFPSGSGLSILSSTCGNPIGPGQSCAITLQLNAPARLQTISAALCEWAKPSVDGVRFPFSVTVVNNPFLQGLIAVGNYQNTSAIQNPLIFFSSNNGSSWSSVTTSLPPDFSSDGSLAASACTGLNCIGAGIYDNGAVNRPLLVFSSNGGSSWTFVTAPVPVDFVSSAVVRAATCEASTCVAVGAYSNGPLVKALILVSNDSGASWSAVAPTLPVNFLNFASLNAVTCIASTCVAAGSYTRVGNIQEPLLLVSNDAGTSWSSVTPTLPPTFSNLGSISSVTCEGSVCIGTGVFFQAGFQARPLVLVSNNLGSSWGFVTPTLPGDFSNFGFFNAVTCTGAICNGAGNYSDGSITKPLLFHSTNSGASFSSVAITLPANFFDLASLRSITCTGTNCMAAGDYADASFTQFPMLGISSDQGASWTSFALTLPADYSDFGTINALNCNGDICTAVGTYTNVSNTELPLIYVSNNGGITWSLVAPTLPANFSDQGILNATS